MEKSTTSKSTTQDLRLSKRWLSSRSLPFSHRGRLSLHLDLYRLQDAHRHVRRLSTTVPLCRRTLSTAVPSRPQNKDCTPCGQNQFCIQSQKIGTDHTSTVQYRQTLGETNMCIAQKEPLYQSERQTDFRLSSCHTELTKLLEAKE